MGVFGSDNKMMPQSIYWCNSSRVLAGEEGPEEEGLEEVVVGY